MATRETGQLWALPGRPWADVQLTQSTAGWLMSEGQTLEVLLDQADDCYVVFVDEEQLYCALTQKGLDNVKWTSGKHPWWNDWYDDDCDNYSGCPCCRYDAWPEPEGDLGCQPWPPRPKTGLKPTAEMKREDAESKQPIQSIGDSLSRMRSASVTRNIERRLVRKPREVKRRSAKLIRRRQRERITPEEV